MAKCSFCSEAIKPGTGFLFVRKDGSALFFCSRKCERNMVGLRRHPAATKWTGQFQREKKARKAGEREGKKR